MKNAAILFLMGVCLIQAYLCSDITLAAIESTAPKPIEFYRPPPVPHRRLTQLITEESNKANISPKVALAIAKCESRFDPKATNPSSTAKGLYQFLDNTWINYCDGYVFNAEDNLKCFLKLYPAKPEWWECKS